MKKDFLIQLQKTGAFIDHDNFVLDKSIDNEWSVIKKNESNDEKQHGDAIIMSIPHQIVISPTTALLHSYCLNDYCSITRVSKITIKFELENFEIQTSFDNAEKDRNIVFSPDQLIIIMLCELKMRKNISQEANRLHEAWNAYVEMLPSDPSNLPFWNWTISELEDRLEGTGLNKVIITRKKALKSDYKSLIKQLKLYIPTSLKRKCKLVEELSWKDYLWADCMLKSRSFFFMKPAESCLQNSFSSRSINLIRNLGELQALQDKMSLNGTPCLLPLLDIMNHSPSAKINWETTNSHIKFKIDSYDRLDDGAEVFNNYGKKSNEELLMSYGFCIDPCLNDVQKDLDYVRLTLSSSLSKNVDSKTIYLHYSLDELPAFIRNVAEAFPAIRSKTKILLIAFDLLVSKLSAIEKHHVQDTSFDFVRIYRQSQLEILNLAIVSLEEWILKEYTRELLDQNSRTDESNSFLLEKGCTISDTNYYSCIKLVSSGNVHAGDLLAVLDDCFYIQWSESESEYDISVLCRIYNKYHSRMPLDRQSELIIGKHVFEGLLLEFEENVEQKVDMKTFNEVIRVHEQQRFTHSFDKTSNYVLPPMFRDNQISNKVGNIYLDIINDQIGIFAASELKEGDILVLVNWNISTWKHVDNSKKRNRGKTPTQFIQAACYYDY